MEELDDFTSWLLEENTANDELIADLSASYEVEKTLHWSALQFHELAVKVNPDRFRPGFIAQLFCPISGILLAGISNYLSRELGPTSNLREVEIQLQILALELAVDNLDTVLRRSLSKNEVSEPGDSNPISDGDTAVQDVQHLDSCEGLPSQFVFPKKERPVLQKIGRLALCFVAKLTRIENDDSDSSLLEDEVDRSSCDSLDTTYVVESSIPLKEIDFGSESRTVNVPLTKKETTWQEILSASSPSQSRKEDQMRVIYPIFVHSDNERTISSWKTNENWIRIPRILSEGLFVPFFTGLTKHGTARKDDPSKNYTAPYSSSSSPSREFANKDSMIFVKNIHNPWTFRTHRYPCW